jgi:hypothetical protein
MSETLNLELTREEAFDLVSAIELSPLEHEVVLAKLLHILYPRQDTPTAA